MRRDGSENEGLHIRSQSQSITVSQMIISCIFSAYDPTLDQDTPFAGSDTLFFVIIALQVIVLCMQSRWEAYKKLIIGAPIILIEAIFSFALAMP